TPRKDMAPATAAAPTSSQTETEAPAHEGEHPKAEPEPLIDPKASASGFNYETLIEKARNLSKQEYEAPQRVPDFLTQLNPDEYSKIHFKREAALGHAKEKPFQAMFYLPGSYYDH